MTPKEIISQIRVQLPELKSRYGVERIGLFGSYANKKGGINSDLDFLVDLNPPYAKNYFDLLFFLEKTFGKKIDLVRRGKHLRDKFLLHVENEVIYA